MTQILLDMGNHENNGYHCMCDFNQQGFGVVQTTVSYFCTNFYHNSENGLYCVQTTNKSIRLT